MQVSSVNQHHKANQEYFAYSQEHYHNKLLNNGSNQTEDLKDRFLRWSKQEDSLHSKNHNQEKPQGQLKILFKEEEDLDSKTYHQKEIWDLALKIKIDKDHKFLDKLKKQVLEVAHSSQSRDNLFPQGRKGPVRNLE